MMLVKHRIRFKALWSCAFNPLLVKQWTGVYVEARRVHKDGGWIWLQGSELFVKTLRVKLEKQGVNDRMVGVWMKSGEESLSGGDIGQLSHAEVGGVTCGVCAYFMHGGKRVESKVVPTLGRSLKHVLNSTTPGKVIHPGEKPVGILTPGLPFICKMQHKARLTTP